MRIPARAALWALSTPLFAQGVYKNVDKIGDPICPKVEMENDPRIAYGQSGYGQGANQNLVNLHQELHTTYPMGQRKNVTAFTAYDPQNGSVSVGSLKGKMVVVGFWSLRCDPSAKMLMELAQLNDRKEKFGFEVLAVNLDANRLTEDSHFLGGWNAVKRFRTDNQAFLEAHPLPFYLPGTGKEGPSNFLETVNSLPLLAVIDRSGQLFSLDMGYTPKLVAHRLSELIREEQAAKAAKN